MVINFGLIKIFIFQLVIYSMGACYRSQFGLDNHLSFCALRLCLRALSDIV